MFCDENDECVIKIYIRDCFKQKGLYIHQKYKSWTPCVKFDKMKEIGHGDDKSLFLIRYYI